MFFMLTPLLLLAVLFIVALLVGLIVLLVKGPEVFRWMLVVFGVLILIGFFGMFTFQRPVIHTPGVHPMMLPEQAVKVSSPVSAFQVDKDPVVWNEGMEEQLTPTVYSSLSAAAYGLGVQLQETILRVTRRCPGTDCSASSRANLHVDIAMLEQLRRKGLKFVYAGYQRWYDF